MYNSPTLERRFELRRVEAPGAGFRCANCNRTPRDDENPDDEWRAYSDGLGELHVFCPECAEREFGSLLEVEPRDEQ